MEEPIIKHEEERRKDHVENNEVWRKSNHPCIRK
uniref:Uncharacterized protein n=1 Tax=Arundo donax TaxID=35708 RepID=A0A0A9FSN1_ARUDO